MRRKTVVGAGLLLAAMLGCAGCDGSRADARAPGTTPVTVIVSPPVVEPVPETMDYTGRTDAVYSVEIRSRVTGFLRAVLFEDGALVEQGAPLYEIDDREYQADLEVAQGDLTSARSRADKNTTDYERAVSLKQRGAISEEDFDRARALKDESLAAVESASAALARKKLNVEFSRIPAPISGRISRNLVSAGNLVSADVTALTTIVSVDPIDVYFDVDERTILTVQTMIREGRLEEKHHGSIPLQMGLTIDRGYPYSGVIDFIDNRVDPRTGTIRVRGRFANPKPDVGDRPLSPGLFARVRVPLDKPRESLLVTERAIGTDQGRKYVYVVNEANEVEYRGVDLGVRYDGLRAVTSGLQAGDRVIIDGLQRVRPGSVVAPKVGDMRGRPSQGPAPARPKATDDAGQPAAADAVTP